MWDWGHAEGGTSTLFLISMWWFRYRERDLYTECDPRTHADCWPTDLETELERRNVVLAPGKLRNVVIAESHEHALPFFFSRRQMPDALINIDAHHDCFMGSLKGDCANWLRLLAYMPKWEGVPFYQLYPKWKDAEIDGPPRLDPQRVTFTKFAEWTGFDEPHAVRNVFICRSGAWTPPHLDPVFIELTSQWLLRVPEKNRTMIPPIPTRPYPSREEAATQRQETAIAHETLLRELKILLENNA